MFLRFTTAGEIPLKCPLPSMPADPLAKLRIITDPLIPDVINVMWDPNSFTDNLMLAYGMATFSGRLSPTLNKMTFIEAGPTSWVWLTWFPRFRAIVYHIRLDLVSHENGDLLGRRLLRLPNPWP